MKYYFSPDMTVYMASAIVLITIYFMLKRFLSIEVWYYAIPTILFIGLFLFFFLRTPLYTSITDDAITVKRVIGKKIIDKKEVIQITQLTKKEMAHSVRVFGNGGFFGYSGKFNSPKLGNYNIIATNLSELAKIELKNGEVWVINYPKELFQTE